MGLLGNGFRHNLTGKLFGGTSLDGANPSVHEYRGHLTACMRNQFAGEAGLNATASVPDGCRHPVAWVMPRTAGGLSSRGSIVGSGGATSAMQSGYNIDAALSGSGGVSSATMGLIVSISAALTASGGISSASVQALASMVAELTGSGTATATAQGLASLGAALTGTGDVIANNTALMDIVAQIRGYGDLTPEGIRDTVWQAVLANYPISGTAGNTLALAGSGGVDYTALGLAVWASVSRTLTAGAVPTAEEIATAILAAATTTPIHSDTRKMNGAVVQGDGSSGNLWRGV